MSPVGGVGINLAIQDAVATANILAEKLCTGRIATADLASVQSRRTFPTRMTQWLQVQIQNRILSRALANRGATRPPIAMRLFHAFPLLRRIPARLVGLGFRPEHVKTRDAFAK
jgi:2-polyprenyl-6-methoxyphenol hydroxylase-like FAD-dependent oxidoreductase